MRHRAVQAVKFFVQNPHFAIAYIFLRNYHKGGGTGRQAFSYFKGLFIMPNVKVLESIGYSGFSEYFNSELWASIRGRAIAEHGGRCLTCGAVASMAYNYDYSEATLRGIDLDGLVPLCKSCYSRFSHKSHKQARGMLKGLMWKYYHTSKGAATPYSHPIMGSRR